MFRIGQGFDIHKLVEGRKLIIGGIEIDYPKGLLGHSDADVLIHSIIDALLGALALGDIGTHFPDNDPQYKNIDSTILLRKTKKLIEEKGYKINNLDNTIFAQEPKMKPYIPLIREKLSQILEIDKDLISIKAKTMEGQDSVGEKKSISTQSVVLLIKE
ncbi:TPA: 2-C-methyl-D-erythritol 2,4-cyclodiphosphate synthase [Candidatus Avigastranaerophilus faecigallinarum]|nr:2-C-methyl-D-erythritol 2,4-cyclodiphosphate synthase [Candidatus Avigastranaerophilus faecigallinarum]